MLIVIANAHSIANPGDTAIVLGTIKLLREIHPEARITVVSRTAELDKKYYLSIDCNVISATPNLEIFVKANLFDRMFSVGKAFQSYSSLKKIIRKCDLVLLCGGGYFYSERKITPGFSFMSNMIPLVLASYHKKPIISMPQSCGPFKSFVAKRMFLYVMKHSKKIFSREAISESYIEKTYGKMNTIPCPDMAFYLFRDDENQIKAPIDRKKQFTIGVTVRKWGGGTNYICEIVSAIKDISLRHWIKVKIIVQVRGPHEVDDDLESSKQLRDQLKEECKNIDIEMHVKHPTFSLEEIEELYSKCDLVLGMRFHSVIISLCRNVPALAIGYQHKSQGILEYMDLAELYAGSYDNVISAEMVVKIEYIISNYENIVTKIRRKVLEAKRLICQKVGYEIKNILSEHEKKNII